MVARPVWGMDVHEGALMYQSGADGLTLSFTREENDEEVA